MWAAGLLLLVVAAFVVLSLAGSLSSASHAPTLPEVIKPTVESQKALAIARPFDSDPWPVFVPTRASEVTLARYPLEKAHEQAALLDIDAATRVPRPARGWRWWSATWPSATIPRTSPFSTT
jgi:hypothetical protein